MNRPGMTGFRVRATKKGAKAAAATEVYTPFPV